MFKYIFLFIILFHGLIHVMGFAKAYGYVKITQIKKDISRRTGIVWLLAVMLFIISATGFLLNGSWWSVISIFAVTVSQVVIFKNWKDTKYGTIVNLFILLVAISAWSNHRFESSFIRDVNIHLQQNKHVPAGLLSEADIQSLPSPVQKYLRYCGALGKPKIKNVRIAFRGEMRGKNIDWFPFTSLQYNFFEDPARLFFIKGKMYGLYVPGYHDYQNGTDRMNIKLFGFIPVVHADGAELDKTETVTYFNDLCLFAPSALIDKRISWEPADSNSVRATFTYGVNKISAMLFFNQIGQLVNFISDDRSPINEVKPVRFSTPVKDYKNIGGRNIPTYGEAVWHYPDGEYVYGKFYLQNIEYSGEVGKWGSGEVGE